MGVVTRFTAVMIDVAEKQDLHSTPLIRRSPVLPLYAIAGTELTPLSNLSQ